MAYVGISRSFMDEVKNQIERMHQAETQQLSVVEPKLTGGEAIVLNALWQGHMQFKDTLPKEWGTYVEDYTVTFKVPVPEGNKERSMETTGKFPKKVFAPPGDRGYYNRLNIKIKVDATASNVPLELQQAYEFLCQLHTQNMRWAKVQEDVKKFLGACKSVNEAIKLWPDVVMYLPKDVIDKVAMKRDNTKTESAAAGMLSVLNTEELTSAAVIARLSGFKK